MFLNEPVRMVFINIIIAFTLSLGVLIYRYVFPKRRINLLILLILISILPIISIFRSGTYESGDLTLHSVFLQSFFENLKEGIFLPQWAGGLCGGFGCPVFEFLYSLPFYISSLFHVLGFSFLNSIKLLLVTSFIGSGITMLMWAKDQFGEKSGFIAAIFYLFAPYHLITLHFRASIGETLSFVFIPLIFLLTKKVITDPKIKWVVLQAISLTLLVLSHFATFISSLYIVLPYAVLLWFLKEPRRLINLKYYAISMILGLLLSLYKWLPSILEMKYTWYKFEGNGITFVPLKSLLISPTNFGFLFQGHHGELNLIIGHIHIILTAMLVVFILKKKLAYKEAAIGVWLLLSFAVVVFLILPQSKFIWSSLGFMENFQFSWRLLIIVSFITSTAAGLVATKIKKNEIIIALCAFAILSTILNWGNRKMVPLDPQAYDKHWSLYTEYFEPNDPLYLFRYNKRVQKIPQLVLNRHKSHLEIIQGIGNIKETKRTQTEHEYLVNARSNLYLSENTYYFPGWKVYANGKEIPINIKNEKRFGTLTFTLDKELYIINTKFEDTQIRKIGKIISLISLGLLVTIMIYIPVKFENSKNGLSSLLYNFKMNYSGRILFIVFFTFVFILLVKSLANIVKVINEIKNPPINLHVQVCPPKNENYFKNLKDGDYLYALYRYKSLGVKCKE